MIDWLTRFETVMAMNHGLLYGHIIPCPLATQFRLFFGGLVLWWLAKQLVRQHTFRQWQSQSAPIHSKSKISHAFREACGFAKLRRNPQLLLLERSPYPAFTCGVFQPTIFLETTFAKRLDERELVAVLTHEMMHIRRRDNLRYLLLELALTTTPLWMVQFFGSFFLKNPWLVISTLLATPAILILGNCWLRRGYHQRREFECDRLTVSLGGDPLELASALAKAAHFFQARAVRAMAHPATVALHAQACTGLVERRIHRLLYPRTTSRMLVWPLKACGFVCAAMVLFFFWKFYVADSYDPILQNWQVLAKQIMMQ